MFRSWLEMLLVCFFFPLHILRPIYRMFDTELSLVSSGAGAFISSTC